MHAGLLAIIPESEMESEPGPRPISNRRLLRSAQIFAGARVDLHNIADGDKWRHSDLEACFHRCRLILGGCRRALERRISVSHSQFDRGRQLDIEGLAFV